MQIAITSQNRRTITQHAGKCRAFWIYRVEAGQCQGKRLIELPIDQSFHAHHEGLPAPLADINVLITGSMGTGLYQRLTQQGIKAIVTSEEDPDEAVEAFLSNSLAVLPNNHRHLCEHHEQ